MLTTSDKAEDRIKSYAEGAAGYIIKPVKYEEFIDMMSAIKKYWSINQIADDDGSSL